MMFIPSVTKSAFGSKVISGGQAQEYDNPINLPFFIMRNATYSFPPYILLYMKDSC